MFGGIGAIVLLILFIIFGFFVWPKATIDHPPFQGHAEEFCDAALEFIALVDVSMHSVTNIRIEIDGDRAYTEAHYTAYHRMRAGLGAHGMIAQLLCPHQASARRFGRYSERRLCISILLARFV